MTKLLAEFTTTPAVMADDYKEDWARSEYIEPLFEALGWTRLNPAQRTNESTGYIREVPLATGSSKRAPDYGFYIRGRLVFYAEAKKPRVNIKTDKAASRQIRSYGWTRQHAFGILTDFQEFAVYDCRLKPEANDGPRVGLVEYFTAQEYEDRWEWLLENVSPEGVAAGTLSDAIGVSRPTGKRQPVDLAFLREIESWREALAEDLITHNELTQRVLSNQVQTLIDRIVFLRIIEARGLEPQGRLRETLESSPIYPALVHLFELADTRYNSGLFHFREESGRGVPDLIGPNLTVPDDLLREIVDRLTSDRSPYRFEIMPAEILGQIYERFLGREIHVVNSHAVVEEKPEYRKSRGVYYTPSYVVDYIVDQTLKPLFTGKSVNQARSVKIVDASCGSGSFLISAYQYLLDWHLDKYKQFKRPADRARYLMTGVDGLPRLRLEERKRILLDNIYGVDIDPQAVEVAKLSLLLKVIEGETQLAFEVDRLLPDLDLNIICGNSLVGTDFYPTDELINLTPDELENVNALDWPGAFPTIAERRGFDAVIGNPPWLMAGYYVADSMAYFHRTYETCTGKADLYYLFLEKSLRIIKPGGRIGMIVPSKLFHTRAARALRGLLVEGSWVQDIVDFGTSRIFDDATNYPCILILSAGSTAPIEVTQAEKRFNNTRTFSVPRAQLTNETWHLLVPDRDELWAKIRTGSVTLESLSSHFGNGVQTGADRLLIFSDDFRERRGIERDACRPILKGKDIRDFSATPRDLVLFPYRTIGGSFAPLAESELREMWPGAHAYLLEHRAKLESRKWFGSGPTDLSGQWYGMMFLDNAAAFAVPHLVTPALSNRSNFAVDAENLFVTGTAGVSSVVLERDDEEFRYFLLGLLNSTLLSKFVVDHSTPYQGGYWKFSAAYIKPAPIRLPNPKLRSSQRLATEIAKLAKAIARPPEGVTAGTGKALRRRLDDYVMRFYELNDDDIAVLET